MTKDEEIEQLKDALEFYGVEVLEDGSTRFKPSTMRKFMVAEAQKQGLETPQLRKAVRQFLEAYDKGNEVETSITLVKLRAEMLDRKWRENDQIDSNPTA